MVHKKTPEISLRSKKVVEMVGESRRQGSSTGDAGARGVLDCGFPGVFSSYTRIRTHLAVLDVGSTPSFYHQTTKEGPMDPLCCLVEMAGVEPGSKYWIFNVSENPADSFADSAAGLSDIRPGRF